MSNYINILGLFFSVYFYTWLHPDLQANVRIGLHSFKVDCMVYFGSVVFAFLAMCFAAPRYTRRTNALMGNIGMAVCSITVVLNHYLMEKRWTWGGLMYIINVMIYVFFLGLTMMGQISTYYYDRNRIIKVAIPVIPNTIMSLGILTFIQNTGYSDVMPCISFGIHTTMAILAQVCGPRVGTFDLFKFLNKRKRN